MALTLIYRMFATLDQVGVEDVRHAAQTYLVPERSTIAVLHTKGEEIPTTAGERTAAAGAVAREASAPHDGVVSQPTVLLHAPQEPNVAIDLPYSNFAYSQTGTPWPVNQAVYVDYMLHDLRGYHAYHAARARLLRRLGWITASREAYDAAIALAGNTAEVAYLTRQREEAAGAQ